MNFDKKNQPVFLGIDVGTTGTKACFFDIKMNCISSGYSSYETVFLPNNGAEQDPEDWIKSTVEAVKIASEGLDTSTVEGIGMSTQAGSTGAFDENFKPLMRALGWMDNRANEDIKELAKVISPKEIYRRTGWEISPVFDPAKFHNVKKNFPELYPKIRYLLSTPDYVTYRLTGELAIDPTNAALRQIYNVVENKYDRELLGFCSMTEENVPPVKKTGSLVGRLTEEGAEMLGLRAGVPLFCAAHDQYCAALGGGAVSPGDMIIATGTAWVIFAVSEVPLYGGISSAPHPAGHYGAIASFGGGEDLKWFKRIIGTDYKDIDIGAEKCMESARHLYMTPYVTGANFPNPDHTATATFFGLKSSHTKFDMARAIMECVTFEAKRSVEVFVREGFRINTDEPLTVTGGAAESPLWRGIISAVLDRPVRRTLSPQACCSGAAVLAAAGLGYYSIREASELASILSEAETPDPAVVEFYREKYADYLKLVPGEDTNDQSRLR